MRLGIASFFLLTIFFGCGRADSPATKQSDDHVATALLRSSAVQRYISSIESKWTYLRDDTIDGGVIVAVGEDREDHFTRGLTAKVMDDGRVFILTTQSDGEEVWKPD
jgi:hypothetical protein